MRTMKNQRPPDHDLIVKTNIMKAICTSKKTLNQSFSKTGSFFLLLIFKRSCPCLQLLSELFIAYDSCSCTVRGVSQPVNT